MRPSQIETISGHLDNPKLRQYHNVEDLINQHVHIVLNSIVVVIAAPRFGTEEVCQGAMACVLFLRTAHHHSGDMRTPAGGADVGDVVCIGV